MLEEETVTVHCVGLGSSLRWYVNTILQTGSNEAIFKIESADIIEIGDSYYWNSTMTTIATLDRNYTNIRCSINGESTLDASNDTTITLAGKTCFSRAKGGGRGEEGPFRDQFPG